MTHREPDPVVPQDRCQGLGGPARRARGVPAHRPPPPARRHLAGSTGGGSHRAPARAGGPARAAVLVAVAVAVATLAVVLGHGDRGAALGEADGTVPDGVTVFDDDLPAVADLDPDLLTALRRAATDAADDRVAFVVNSGWRSREYQDQLLREAVAEYGSEERAARWVATADTSAHVTGDAVDIGPTGATAWLSEHGAEYGLCQIYRNEPWHYELRPDAVDDGCPPPYADVTHDPRTQQ